MKKFIQKYSEKPSNLFQKLFVTFLFGYLPFAIIHLILNILRIIPVNYNDTQVYGLKGALVIILFIPFIVLIITFFVWLYFIFGNLILRLIKKIFYE